MRIAVASTPLTATLEEAVPAAIAAIDEAARLGARIVCLPETGIPGHRSQPRPIPGYSAEAIDEALRTVAASAKIVAIVGTEKPTPRGREIRSVVLGIGEQAKTQIDPTEEPAYIPGRGRRVFTVDGLTFGIAICHEAFRYPEIARSLVLAGARVLFVPHYVTSEVPCREWCAPSNPYNEKALLCRALENNVYVASSNIAGADQGSKTCIIGPQGELLASVEYGHVGVAAFDIDLGRATALLAKRWAPERNVIE